MKTKQNLKNLITQIDKDRQKTNRMSITIAWPRANVHKCDFFATKLHNIISFIFETTTIIIETKTNQQQKKKEWTHGKKTRNSTQTQQRRR